MSCTAKIRKEKRSAMGYEEIHGRITELSIIGNSCLILIEPTEHIFWLHRANDFNGQKLKIGDKVKMLVSKNGNTITVRE